MGYVIAIAGKGGTGKTTLAALITRIIKEKKLGSVLAVDADPNSNLAEVLGIPPVKTIGVMLDEIAKAPDKVPSGMSKDRFIEYELASIIQEADGFDLLSMGKPEGPGCYCYVNNVLRNAMANLIRDYDYVIIDNEAGLEHLSRRTTRQADALVVVTDATPVGLRAAGRINALTDELEIKIKKKLLLVNRFSGEFEKEKIKSPGLEFLGCIPHDDRIAEISLNGNALLKLEENAISLDSLRKIGEQIWQK